MFKRIPLVCLFLFFSNLSFSQISEETIKSSNFYTRYGDTSTGLKISDGSGSQSAGYLRFGDGTGWKFVIGRRRESVTGLENSGTLGNLLTLQDNGNLGLGITSPIHKFEAIGESFFLGSHTNSSASSQLNISSGVSSNSLINFGFFSTFDANIWKVGRFGSDQSFRISNFSGGSELPALTVTQANNIGIGTTSPGAKLEVKGGVRFNENWFPYSDGSNYHRAKNHIFADEAGNEYLRVSSDGKIAIGSTSALNSLDLGSATANRGVSWGGKEGNYSNIWTQYSSGNLVIATGLAPKSNSSGFVSSNSLNLLGKAAMVLGVAQDPGDIMFYSNPPSSVTAGADFSPTERLRVKSNGNVGIGTSNPSQILTVKSANPSLLLETSADPTNYNLSLKANYDAAERFSLNLNQEKLIGHKAMIKNLPQGYLNSYYGVAISTGVLNPSASSVRLYIDGDGAVGIGTVDIPAGYKMAIAGNVIAEKIKVKSKASGWPDYVFNKDYNLRSVIDLKSFIEKNGHLPEVPRATDIEKDGHDVGELNKILLKKIEELTLYIVNQEERLQRLESQLKDRN